jgi:hypothetical protein
MELTLQVLKMETRQSKAAKAKAVVGSREKKPQVEIEWTIECIRYRQ